MFYYILMWKFIYVFLFSRQILYCIFETRRMSQSLLARTFQNFFCQLYSTDLFIVIMHIIITIAVIIVIIKLQLHYNKVVCWTNAVITGLTCNVYISYVQDIDYSSNTTEYLTELCRPASSSSGRQCLRSASRGDLIVPRFRLRRSGYRAFAVSGPHLWNSLPTKIRQSCNNYSSRVNWKHSCSSSPEPFCGFISNEGPYKYSILLLLLLLL